MRIVVAPDSFKESLTAAEAAEAIARGIARARPEATVVRLPLADGGEGTVDAMIAASGGRRRRTPVTGPLGERVEAAWGMLDDEQGTAVIEMAAASGLALVPADRRNPELTTTFGTGELIMAALGAGARRLVVGIGGSATTDGGAGAAQAAGVRFLDAAGRRCPAGLSGGALREVHRIDLAGRDPRLAAAEVLVACDVDNPLTGPRGAAAVYGPQKGATPEQVERLDRNLAYLADVIERDLGRNVRDFPGAGAAGGLGAGLVAFLDATLRPGVQLVMNALRFGEQIAGADLVITGEGRLDAQSLMGKVIGGVGQACREAGVPVMAMVGSAGEGAEATLELLESYHAITPPGTPLSEAIGRAAEALESATAEVLRRRMA